MMGNCDRCGHTGPHDYCPLCGEWFCVNCWGSCEDKDCAFCITTQTVRRR